MARDQFYWDANAFSGFLNGEPEKTPNCESVLEQAKAGHILIVTSALTIAEVLFIRQGPKLPPEKRDKVEKFFKADYISVKNVTRAIAEMARDVFWDHGIKPKDAIHIATAMMHRIPTFHTFDDDLIKKSGLSVNEHVLKIEIPKVPHQRDWISEKKEKE